MLPYRSIEQAEKVETPISQEMITALDTWHSMYLDKADWLDDDSVHSLNLAAMIACEEARQILLEMKVSITAPLEDEAEAPEDGSDPMNKRAQFLADEFEKILPILRQKLEIGLAAGGMIIKPYPNTNTGHIHFDLTPDWNFYPLSFDDDGMITELIIPEIYVEGKNYYTRLERHKLVDGHVEITQRAFKSNNKDTIGTEIPLTDVEHWAGLMPESQVNDTEGSLFGWFKVASANTIDPDCPLGVSCFAKAKNLIKQADMQYSRLLWEYKASEMAIDVDPTALRPRKDGNGQEMPALDRRLFRQVDIDKGDRDLYEVFAPNIRDANYIGGLNQLLMRIEDLCGLSRGVLSDANSEPRTATELRIVRQRTYSTISENQDALERCLRDVIRAMDKYADAYKLAPAGDYEVSFEWDDSVLTDANEELQKRMLLFNAGMLGKAEMREWYFGETPAQAKAAIEAVAEETREIQAAMTEQLLPQLENDLIKKSTNRFPDDEDEEDEGKDETNPGEEKGKDE